MIKKLQGRRVYRGTGRGEKQIKSRVDDIDSGENSYPKIE